FSARFPAEMPTRVDVELTDGTTLSANASAYKGFVTDPLSWEDATAKYTRLVEPFAGADFAQRIADAVRRLDELPVSTLTHLLGQVAHVRAPPRRPLAHAV